jgi:phospholipase/carboxylesterase
MSRVNRREFGVVAGSVLASWALGACEALPAADAQDARIKARPRPESAPPVAGDHALNLDISRDAVLHVPPNAGRGPIPLIVLLHGAGNSGGGILRRLGAAADTAGVAVLAPDSRGSTWDAVRSRFGPDVAFLNRALERVFGMIAVDPARVGVGGFSDGATYGLSLGLVNGSLFRTIVAFSPGFLVEGPAEGRPRCFVSHGTRDDILPIERCSRVIVPLLRQRGHEVIFREFNGGHEIPPAIAAEGLQQLTANPRLSAG